MKQQWIRLYMCSIFFNPENEHNYTQSSCCFSPALSELLALFLVHLYVSLIESMTGHQEMIWYNFGNATIEGYIDKNCKM